MTKLEYHRVEGSGFEWQIAVASMIDYTARPWKVQAKKGRKRRVVKVEITLTSTAPWRLASSTLPTVQYLGQGPGFRVQGFGFRVQEAGITVQGSGFRAQGPGCQG